MVFQDPLTSLHPMLTIGRQLTEHVEYHLGLGRQAAEQRARELLEQVRIPDGGQALHAYPHQFSGGMRQRIAIAIALACRPKLLIADEPTTALDVTVQAGILRLLDRLRRENDLAVVLITHDLGVMSAIADRVSIFYAGRVVESGGARERAAAAPPPLHAGAPRRAPPPRGARGTRSSSRSPARRRARAGIPAGCAFNPRCAYARETLPDRGAAAGVAGRPPARLSGRPLRAAMSALELRDVVVDYESRDGGRLRAVAGASISVEAGPDRRARRRVGLRQVDARPGRRRARQAHLGLGRLRRARGDATSAGAAAAASSPGCSSSSRTPTPRSTRAGGSARSSPTRSPTSGSCPPPSAPAGRASSASSSGCRPARSTASRTSSRAASASGSRSPARSPPSRR